MDTDIGHIVISLAGRDKGRPFYVLKTEENFVYLIDGRLRKIESPKKKKKKHVKLISDSETRISTKLKAGEKIFNSEIRKALSDYAKAQGEEDAATSTGR